MTTTMDDQSLSDRNFKRFAELVYEHSRINLGERKQALVRTRLGKVMRQKGIQSFDEYYDYVVGDSTGEAVREMINAISTNLTSFFREGQHFQFLEEVCLPQILQGLRGRGERRVRAWSAGCSTGEEPYTLAIVLSENVPDLTNWDVRILATDIDSTVLDRGREGVYRKKQIEPVPPMLRQKYLIRQGTRQEPEFLVRPELKRLVAFRHLNLMTTPYPFQGPFQVIFCRNVMIYFRRDTQAELVNRFFHLLSPGGYLFVGHSESLTGIQHPFQYIRPTVYRRPE